MENTSSFRGLLETDREGERGLLSTREQRNGTLCQGLNRDLIFITLYMSVAVKGTSHFSESDD